MAIMGLAARWTGWAAGAVLLLPVGIMRAQSSDTDDPANLKGERVRAVAAEPLAVDQGAKGVAGMLQKLATRASLLMIVAHPDDEDGGMLTYESRGAGARVGMLTLTRGEGGQNVMSGDFNEALGLVRTRELLAADRYLGIDQMFGTEVDFGFSKTKEEAFSQWTHGRVLYDAVRAVRLYRPLVVTSAFLGAPTDGHGQHQVSGEIAQEVFKAAADPKVFPEMGLPAWAPAKVYGRMPFAPVSAGGMFDYATGKTVPVRFENYVTGRISNSAPEPTVMVPEGEPSSLLGASYVQFARQGLALQKTQIGSGVRLAPAGRFDVGYTRYGSRVGGKDTEASFFDGVDVSLTGIAGLAPSISRDQRDGLIGALRQIDGSVKKATAEFDAAHPEKTAPTLRQGLQVLDRLVAQVEDAQGVNERERYDVLHELRVKRVQFNEALVDALGLQLTAGLDGASGSAGVLVPGQGYAVRMELKATGGAPLTLEGCGLEPHTGGTNPGEQRPPVSCADGATAVEGTIADVKRTLRGEVAPDSEGVRVPYVKASSASPVYQVSDGRMRNAALPLPALTARADLRYDGVPLRIERIVGQEMSGAYQPVTVVPAVSVGLTPPAGIAPMTEKSFTVTARLRGAKGGGRGTVRLEVPKGWRTEPARAEWTGARTDDDVTVPFRVVPDRISVTPYTLTAVAEEGGKEYREGFTTVGYTGVVRDDLYRPATTRVQGVALQVPAGLKVAYLPGTGDAVEDALGQLGVSVTRVSVAEIAAGKLAGYDALVMGVRAYAAHKDLPGVTAQVTAFARAGGAVVVQYNTAEYGGADAPFPLSLGSAEKVVEETAAVRLLQPKSQVLSWPNQITEHDFEGWVEERGHGFMGEWDPKYRAVTEVQDVGQDPQRGGLLVAPVGKGAYVYCAYALYRQLPEGVPGAFRLLANMVSLGRRP